MHLVGGEKGGVGKSMLAKLLAQLFIDRGARWVGFDTDRSQPTFARCYGEWVQPIDIGRAARIDLSVEALEDGAGEVVIDLAGQSDAHLWRWIETGEVIEFLARLGHQAWFWPVTDGSHDSVRAVATLLERLAGRARIVCVVNRGRGRDFALFEESKLADRIAQAGGTVIDLPELHPDSMQKMDAWDKSFWAAVNNDDPTAGPCLTLMQRQRARVFLNGVQATLGAVLDGTTNDAP